MIVVMIVIIHVITVACFNQTGPLVGPALSSLAKAMVLKPFSRGLKLH